MSRRLSCLKAESARCVLKGDSGVVALEFALTAPLLLLLVLGTMAFAIHFAILVGVIHAASEGARASIGGLGASDRQSLAIARVQQIFTSYGPLMTPDKATVNAQPGATSGTYAVTVNYDSGSLGIDSFVNLWSHLDGHATPPPSQISYTATVGDGGY